MNRTEIISNLYADKDIRDAINKMNPDDLRDDLRQEMFLVICEMSEDKLVERYKEGSLKFYLVRTMLNMIKSDRSTFYLKFRRQFEEWTVAHDKPMPNDDSTDEIILDKVKKSVEQLHWYERELLRLHAESGKTLRSISKETKIPYRSILLTVKTTRTRLRKIIRNGDNK